MSNNSEDPFADDPGVQRERDRVAGIKAIAKMYPYCQSLAARAIDDGTPMAILAEKYPDSLIHNR